MKGIDVFREYFRDFSDQYILIGGAACGLVFDAYEESFRATKDIDMVLFIEMLSPAFGVQFWQFIEDGQYTMRTRSSGEPEFFRFYKPQNAAFPEMIELFSRAGQSVLPSEQRYMKVHVGDDISSLSAILLNDDYYDLLHMGATQIQGISVLDAVHLIPFKAKAFLDLSGRRDIGDVIDSRKIRKHKNDIIRLASILSPSDRCQLPAVIFADMIRLVEQIEREGVQTQVINLLRTVFS